MKKDNSVSAAPPEAILIVFIIGPPGVGKSSHSASLVREFGFVHLNTGDILRKHAKDNPGTEVAAMILDRMRRALLVPDNLALSLTLGQLQENITAGKYFLLDGFPRNCGQAELFYKEVANFGVPILKNSGKALWLEAANEILLARILNRSQTATANAARPDDERDVVLKRIQGYFHHTVPFAEKLAQEEKILRIDCNGEFPVAYQEIRSHIEQLVLPSEEENLADLSSS